MLVDTLLIPRLVLPYLNCCVYQANLHTPSTPLVQGIAASLRTLVIASFRAPPTQYVMSLLKRLNPTPHLLKATDTILKHDYIFALLCLLNVNMNALDLSRASNSDNILENYRAHNLLHEMGVVFGKMPAENQQSVLKRITTSGALPIGRDTPSYIAVMSILHGGAAGQLEYMRGNSMPTEDDGEEVWDSRAEAKKAHNERMEKMRQFQEAEEAKSAVAEPKSAFEVAVSTATNIEERQMQEKESRAEAKGAKATKKKKKVALSDQEMIRGEGYRLLGDLPALGGKTNAQDVRVALTLELPSEKQAKGGMKVPKHAPETPSAASSDIPKEFLCAINGHVMKDPVMCEATGLVFERATIELWLNTRGSVCPISHEVCS